jgi:pyridoxamine 5'-phosphate oxidase
VAEATADPAAGGRRRALIVLDRLLAAARTLVTLGRGVVRGLPPLTPTDDPIAFFQRWFAEAQAAGIYLPESMTLATASTDGAPAARMLLLKAVDRRGFVFYTNYASRKGAELAANPRAALVFHWAVLQRQVRVEGPVARLAATESAAYFRTRARGSRIGAWASHQSAPLADRAELDRRVQEYEGRFAGQDVPLPPFWGGFRLEPRVIEFWQGRVNRLHDRVRYTREGAAWSVGRLYP